MLYIVIPYPCMYIHTVLNRVPTLSRVLFSPSLMYISTTSLVSSFSRTVYEITTPPVNSMTTQYACISQPLAAKHKRFLILVP